MNKPVTSKAVKTYVKYGWTLLDFANDYECSPEEFSKQLKKVFPVSNTLEEVKRQLAQNEKRKAKNAVKKSLPKQEKNEQVVEECVQDVAQSECSYTQEAQVFTDINEEGEMVMIEQVKDNAEDVKEIIDAFLAELENQQKNICNMEALRVSLGAEKRKINEELQEHKKQLRHFQALAKKHAEEVIQAIEKLNGINEKLYNVCNEITTSKEKMEHLNKEIEELKKTTIYVYANCTVECDGPVAYVEPEATKWNPIFEQISKIDEAEDLTIKQIKLLAKIIVFARDLEYAYEIAFGKDEMNEIFNQYINVA